MINFLMMMIQAVSFVAFLASFVSIDGWSTGSAVSSFGGSVLVTARFSPNMLQGGTAVLEMKKGKPTNVRTICKTKRNGRNARTNDLC